MKLELQSQRAETIRKVLITLKNKISSISPLKNQIKQNTESSQEDEDLQKTLQEDIIYANSSSQWGNHVNGNQWIAQQKKINQFKIVDQRQLANLQQKQYKITFLQAPTNNLQTSSSKLFVDKSFPANQESITGQWGFVAKYESVYWQRASIKIPEYALFQDKVSPNSLIQGRLGNCYFLAAVAALAERPDRIFKLFLTNQTSFERRFAVKMLYKGKWRVIELDQFIAFQKDKVQFSRSTRQELWIMLIQKAWAKLYRSYMNICSGHAEQCLHDFTGAPIKFFNLKSKDFDKIKFWKYLIKASKRQYAICASSNPGSDTKMSETGIVQGHAYTLLRAVNLKFHGEKIKLLQLRNPWGRKQSGADWSDSDPLWKKVSQKQKDRLQYQDNKKDGIFFIELQDFVREYRGVVVAQINDNASYVYESRKDPNCEGVLFKLKITETARYSLQVDKTPKRTFGTKKSIKYKYPPAVLKVFDNSGKQIHNYSDAERLTSRKYTLKKGVYYVFVLIQFDSNFETEFDVTLAVYAQNSCVIELASFSDHRIIGQIELPSERQLNKKRFKSSPKATMSEFDELFLSKPNVKFNYKNAVTQNSPWPNVQIKQKLSLVTKSIHSKSPKKVQIQNTNSEGIRNNQMDKLINQIIKNRKLEILNGQTLDLISLIDKQIVFIEASPAQNKLENLMINKKDFLDDRFQPTLASLSGQWGAIPQWKNVRWERISNIMPNAPIFAQSITPYTIRQGFLGDCYFLATLAALAEKPNRILNLFLLTQKNSINYYSVKMLYRGKWLTIDMDDYIPFMYDIPAFSYTVKNQLWVMLLQKAWAKMYSSYKRIEAGFPEEALHDLTAAPIRHIFLQKVSFKPEQEWAYLMKATQLEYSMVASSQVDSYQLKSVSGIVQGHAYTLLKVVQVRVNGQIRRLVQLRNPWGKVEGIEQWSDDAKIWDMVGNQQKKRIGYENKDDGVFFIAYELFYKEFKLITIAQINDNASYVYQSCEDIYLQGSYFTVKIIKQGRYSWQIDNTPERTFQNHYHTDYKYPNINFQLGMMTEYGYIKRIVKLTSNSRALYHSAVFSPGSYICYTKIDFDAKYEKVFEINLAIYGDFPSELRLSVKKEAVMMANNPNINWPPSKKTLATQKLIQWNSLRSYNKSSRKLKY